MSQSSGLNLKNVVRHLPGGNASLSAVNASHSVPMKASTKSRGKKFAIAIAQCQRAKRVWRSNDPSIVINVRCLWDKDGPTFGKTIRNTTSLQYSLISMKEELRTQAHQHICRHRREFRQVQEPSLFFKARRSLLSLFFLSEFSFHPSSNKFVRIVFPTAIRLMDGRTSVVQWRCARRIASSIDR